MIAPHNHRLWTIEWSSVFPRPRKLTGQDHLEEAGVLLGAHLVGGPARQCAIILQIHIYLLFKMRLLLNCPELTSVSAVDTLYIYILGGWNRRVYLICDRCVL